MALKLYNTLTRKKQVFKPIEKGKVGMYTCGPTVYDYAHIGNFRAYVFSDVLKRYLVYLGFEVKDVMNLTDVDDKTIKRSQQEKTSLKEITRKYEEAFLEDMKRLNIIKPGIMPRATEHINEMVLLIKNLIEKGYAYKTDDGIYFSIKKFKEYGKLAKLNFAKLKQTERMSGDNYEKEEARDFVLWKFYTTDDGDVFWQTEIGKGRPGWHIECSAMSMKYLGEHFDLHLGGQDLIFPHHTNEIAQSEAATGKKFVNYWLHNGWLLVDGKKMSKSLGNFYTLRDILAKGFNALALRYFYLLTHYRKEFDFSVDNLKNSQKSYERLRNIISELKDDGKTNEKYLKKFEKAMNDDLDTGKAIQVLWELLRDEKAEGKLCTASKMDKVLGLKLLEKERIEVPEEIKEIVAEREKARENKDWKKSDELRMKMKELGWWVDDTPEGPKIKKL